MRLLELSLLLVLCGCSHPPATPTTTNTTSGKAPEKAPDDAILQGTWEVQVPGGPMGGGLVRWSFTQGAYTLSGYPPLEGAGKYKVARTDGATMLLEFSEQTGDFSQFNSMEVVVEAGGETLTIRGQGPYKRVTE